MLMMNVPGPLKVNGAFWNLVISITSVTPAAAVNVVGLVRLVIV
jgi:hypothetical protein